ncbi:sensor histidine kinase [Nocardioides sp.]|uniref:sensor histidine kinase n=1 Tax=Nocardioides sp. TaxID=35761 RepID=UPI003568022B
MRFSLPPGSSLRTPIMGDDPDPRLLQAGFTFFLALAVALAYTQGNRFSVNPLPTAGLILAAAAFLLAPLVPWRRVPRALMGVLPAVDILALGLARMNQLGDGSSGGGIILVVVPALWLGWLFGRRGALLAIVFILTFAVVPAAIYFGPTVETLTRSVLIAVVSGVAALLIAVSREAAQAGELRAEERGAALTEALATIEHQRRMAEAILESVDVGLVLLDREGNYQQTNRHHRQSLHLAFPGGHHGHAGEAGHIYAADGVQSLSPDELPSALAMSGHEFDDMRIWIGHDPTTRRAISVSSRRVLDEHGDLAGAALAYKDVTAFVDLLKVKDEFLASVSHELRTPLTSIMGYVDLLLEDGELDPATRQQLEVVERNSARLLRLVADLLQAAQTDAGPAELVRSPTDLSTLARESVGAAEPFATAGGIKLRLDTPDRLMARVDAPRIGQVLDNLISNAIKYSPSGGDVRVVLAVAGDEAEIEVSDSGIGIDALDHERLFTRFFRAADARARSIQGIGLGLSVLKAIVEAHGGRVEVESELGVGSVFRVRLPLDLGVPV